MQGSKRSKRYCRELERDRYKVDRYLKKLSSKQLRRKPLTEDFPPNYHKKMIHWYDIDRMW